MTNENDLNVGIGENPEFQVEQRNSFKLTKNSKGKNFEFKIIEDDLELLKKKVLEMNKWSEDNFGEQK